VTDFLADLLWDLAEVFRLTDFWQPSDVWHLTELTQIAESEPFTDMLADWGLL